MSELYLFALSKIYRLCTSKSWGLKAGILIFSTLLSFNTKASVYACETVKGIIFTDKPCSQSMDSMTNVRLANTYKNNRPSPKRSKKRKNDKIKKALQIEMRTFHKAKQQQLKQQKNQEKKHKKKEIQCKQTAHRMTTLEHRLQQGYTIKQGEKIKDEIIKQYLIYQKNCINDIP